MSFIKLGEATEIKIEDHNSVLPVIDDSVIEAHFKRYAFEMKKLAPKADDFLYFSAIMMHAAEASAINPDGSPKLTSKGESVKVGWDKSGGTWRWASNDPSVKPYKNSNGDIFPEEELVKAYRKWKDRPLCIDHKSDSVDYVRGFIVDTYYDRNLKRVVALCALDKFNYPDLARKVSSGYSNSVSMGTAVGKAICYDCGQVARAEKDFCNHMRSKTCYGEINVDLSPIELSIVVNGADQQARIKHIIASAETLSRYVEMKKDRLEEIKKSSVNVDDVMQLRKDFDEAMSKLATLEAALSEEKSLENTNDTALSQTSSLKSAPETELPNTNFNIAAPAQRLAADDGGLDVAKLQEVVSSVEANLSFIKQSLDKLSNSNSTNEENMTTGPKNIKNAFFQGTEEPAPGEVKYPKEPLNEKLRTDGDKHMEAHETGPVDGLFPGDLEKKKMLARAQADERALRRQNTVARAKEALEKKSYFNGTEEPVAPGKAQYPKDPMNEKLREDGDKHMEGQKPFPGVGPVDGMHPSPASADTSDERKRKELLQRASFRARFVKAANEDGTQNKGASSWEVYLGDKLILTSSVNEITGKRADALYDAVATRDFGSKLIDNVKKLGADKVKSLYKVADDAMAPPPGPAPAEGGGGAPDADAGGTDGGDLKTVVKDLVAKAQQVASDLAEAVGKLFGEQAEMGDNLGGLGTSEASDTNTLNKMRRDLNGALTHALKESIAELNDRESELTQILEMHEKNEKLASDNDTFKSVVEDTVEETKTALAESFKLMTAFVKYARGTEAIVKRAEIESELNKLADNGDTGMADTDDNLLGDDGDLMSMLNDADDDIAALHVAFDAGSSEEHNDDDGAVADPLDGVDTALVLDASMSDDNAADMVEVTTPDGKKVTVPAGSKVATASFDLTSKEGRAAYRAKLAADTLKVSPHLHEAHPKGGFTTELDVKPSDNLAEIEDLEQIHDAMMDLANAPPKVRKEAEAIQALVASGQLNPADVESLIAEGLDKDAVAYWKKYWGEAGPEGSQFATELVKEHAKAKMEATLDTHRVKLARAYELTYEMIDRGLCAPDKAAISLQVEEIMKFNDDGFDTLKRVVARHEPLTVKKAGRMPQVGLFGADESSSSSSGEPENLFSQLSVAFSGSGKRMF